MSISNVLSAAQERFESKYNVDPETGCWLWIAAKKGDGRGGFKLNGEWLYAHRVSYEMHKGEIPEGMCVLHTCDVPRCVNPAHLFIGTYQDNTDDMRAKGRDNYGTGGPVLCGEANGRSKLTQKEVQQIRDRYAAGETQKVLGAEFGIARNTVSAIVNKVRWK